MLSHTNYMEHFQEKDRWQDMKKLDMLYEGKAKKVFKTDVEDVLIVDYKDDATAFNGEKKGTITGKGVINNKMTNYLFKKLDSNSFSRRVKRQRDSSKRSGNCSIRSDCS